MIYGVLLAAGTSMRMGQLKQLLDWRGRPLVRYVAEQALTSKIAALVVVVGAGATAVRAALNGLDGPVQTVENPDYVSGQASSLRAGLGALPANTRAAVILLVDQPLISPELINQLIAAYEAQPDMLAVVPHYQGQRGNPVLLSSEAFAELRMLSGDVGARKLLDQYADRVVHLEVDDPAVVTDMDTPEAYERLLHSL